MAKSKKSDNSEELTFLGQVVDPEVQKKVAEYMEVDESEIVGETEDSHPDIIKDGPVSTAPLLPTEELPADVVKSGTSDSKKIDIRHFDDPEEEAVEEVEELNVSEENEPEEVEEVAEGSEEEIKTPEEESGGESPLDSELIDLTTDPDVIAAPDFEDAELDKTKSIGELAENTPMDDARLGQAIEEIVAEDADKLLEVEDSKIEKSEPVVAKVVKAKSPKKPRGSFFKAWFSNPLYRMLTIFGLLLIIAAAAVLPSSRYFVLNTAGVRVSASIKAIDDKTNLPLKNVELIVNGKTSKTDSNGVAVLEKVKLGKQEIVIKKTAFAEIKKTITLGWGSNPLGEQRLVPTGTQITFVAKDYVSEKPITEAEVNFGDSSANFNASGEAVLTVPAVQEDEIEVTVNAKNYREEKIKVNVDTKEKVNIALVPAKPHVFVSKQNGKFDLYKADIDGKNEKVILSATGIEKEESLSLAAHPNKPVVAFASTRENARNKDGFLLTTLNLIYMDTNEVVKVATSERIQLVDWSGDHLVYVKITEGASEANVNRHKIMSYDVEKGTEKELASTNYFNDVVSVKGVIYYSPAVYRVNGKVGLYKINADGSNKKTVYDKEVWNMFRTAYDKFSVSVGQDWYEVNLVNDEVKKVGGAPSVLKSRIYVNSPNAQQSLWVDERDGKSVLLGYNIEKKTDDVLITENGIKNPIYWLDDTHLVYRIADGTEVADYVVSLGSGSPKKIRDVTNTVGIDRWYYF